MPKFPATTAVAGSKAGVLGLAQEEEEKLKQELAQWLAEYKDEKVAPQDDAGPATDTQLQQQELQVCHIAGPVGLSSAFSPPPTQQMLSAEIRIREAGPRRSEVGLN